MFGVFRQGAEEHAEERDQLDRPVPGFGFGHDHAGLLTHDLAKFRHFLWGKRAGAGHGGRGVVWVRELVVHVSSLPCLRFAPKTARGSETVAFMRVPDIVHKV